MRKHSFLAFIGVILLGTAIVCGGVWIVLAASSRPRPSDDQLIANYNQYRSEFQQLAQMLTGEKELLVTCPDKELCQIERQQLIKASDNVRCADYVRQFKQLGLAWSYSGRDPLC